MIQFIRGKGLCLLTATCFLMLLLAACSEEADNGRTENDGVDYTNPQPDENGVYDFEDFSTETDNTEEPIDGGELTYGIVSDSPFEGTLNFNFNSGGIDEVILDWIGEELLWEDEDFMIDDNGAMTFDYDEDEKTMTYTIRDDVKWSDGEPLTAEDYKYAYEVVGHPGYDSTSYDATFTNVVGMEDYHNSVKQKEDGFQTIEEYREENGDTISGIDIIDDQTIKITYKEFSPSLLAGGAWYYAMPKHIFEGMPVEDMSSSDEVRKNPVGLGPYKVDEIVEGESLVLSPNEYYWRGEPQLDKVTIKIVEPSNIVQELKKGKVDIAGFPTDKYPDNDDLTNVQFLADVSTEFEYVGFKLGTWDDENSTVEVDPDMKMADRKLRKAMWHAVDTEKLGNKFYHGLRWRANTLIPPSHENYHADDLDAPSYDPDKANELLDEAGYEWAEGEDYRTDKDGSDLLINFAAMEGGESAEPIAKYFMQSWEEIGLNVELLDGRLQDQHSFYDRVGETGEDDPEIDVFMAGWQLGADVDPARLHGPDALFNFPRYESEESNALIEEGQSVESLDPEHRIDVYREWQKLMIEEIPEFPTLYLSSLTAVNRRVTNFDIAHGSQTYRYEVGVTEEEPVVDE